MPTQIVSSLSQTRQNLSVSDDLAITQTGQLVYTNNQSAIHLGGDNQVHIAGEVVAIQYFGVTSAADAGFVNFHVAPTGSITTLLNYDAVEISTTANIDFDNHGLISGYIGLDLTVNSTFRDLLLTNTGTIMAEHTAAELDVTNADGVVVNSGEMFGQSFGLRIFGTDPTETTDIINSGRIEAASAISTTADVSLRNTGEIVGNVFLSENGDRFDNRSGALSNGGVFGNGGEDVLLGGDGAEDMWGGSGNDAMRGGAGDDSLNGQSEDDTLEGGAGDDVLLGETGFDLLFGNGGHDSMDGGGRADVLIGGKGDDTMTGGGGADVFVIRRVGNGDDEVTDFQNGSDRVDISALGVQNFNQLNNVYGALSQDSDAVVVDLAAAGGSGSIRLVGVTLADMDASDFIF